MVLYVLLCIKDVKVFWYGVINTLKGKKFHWILILAFSLMANSLNLNSACPYYYIFRNLSTIAYIIEIQKSTFANL